jgi:hypothetical protein
VGLAEFHAFLSFASAASASKNILGRITAALAGNDVGDWVGGTATGAAETAALSLFKSFDQA